MSSADEIAAEEAASEAAIAQLQGLQRARIAAPTGASDFGMAPPMPAFFTEKTTLPATPGASLQSDTSNTSSIVSKDVTHLEDLYAIYPIGDGNHYLRVTRTLPVSFMGSRVSGVLGDIYEPIPMEDFTERFGGNTYEISVRGPGSDRHYDDSGKIPTKTLATIKVVIPGVPKTMPSEVPAMQPQAIPSEPPQVKITEMNLHAEERRRADERIDAMQQRLLQQGLTRPSFDPSMLEHMEQVSKSRADEVRSMQDTIIANLRATIDTCNQQLRDRDKENNDLRHEMLKVRTEAAEILRQEETRQIKELKARHTEELQRVHESKAADLTRLMDQHRRDLADLQERNSRERTDQSGHNERELLRMRSEYEHRERMTADETKRREDHMRLQYETQLTAQEKSYERELSNQKDTHKRELESIRSVETTKTTVSENTATFRLDLLNEQLRTANNRLATLERENLDLRSRQHKEPLQAVQEAKGMLEALGVTVGGNDGPAAEEPASWSAIAGSALKQLVEKAPEIVQAVSQARDNNRAAVQQVQQFHGQPPQQFQPMPPQFQQGPPPRQMLQAPPQQQQRQHAPTIKPWGSTWAPPAPGDAPNGTPDASNVRPLSIAPPPKPRAVDALAEVVKAPEVRAPGVIPAAGGAGQIEETSITAEDIEKFVKQLDLAIATGMATPAEFAQKAIESTSPAIVRHVISQITPEQLVAQIEAAPGGNQSAIVTREGRRYVAELWLHARQLTETAA